ncbi:NAD-dependent epimerase/dehydratase family protein [candidate division KSB3 bacterium]|uniref:NAD-dependent epimerase/dehydratase family protein n=1 Tax=candidate division KSB3 bacterium TaxID=2044937 RepID=A0A9D5Q7A3_9BACT|nr:NAD-dependent epimerase/dehydratase family protein [candidate division KSB3 bacterium]MBD3326097.1 NAD-dependent epimerase/dehydratase family protein [candidate division KSB3 bacterium]
MKVLLLGGTGVISREIVKLLLAANHDVVLFNRGTKQLGFADDVQQITGDRSDRDNFESAMQKDRFDAVIDMICFNAEDAKSTVRAFRDNTDHLIVCSSIAAYKRPYQTVPTREDAEELFDSPTFSYAFKKAEMERYLHAQIAAQQLPITIIRPSLTFGPGAANIGVFRQNYGIVERIRQGKPLVMFGDGTTPWNFTFTPDLAKGFVGVLGNSKTFGQAYHITNEDRHVWEDLYLEFGRLVGKTPRIVHIPSELLYKAAPNLCAHLYFEKTYAGLFDNAKIKAAVPGFEATITLHDGLQMVLEWYEREANTVDPEKEALEDRLIALHARWAEQVENLYTK